MAGGRFGTAAGARRAAYSALTLALAVLACEAEDSISGFVGDDETGAIIVDFDARPEDFPRDPYRYEEGVVRGDTLVLRVTHGGGCERHRYALVAWNGWLETVPVRVGVVLAHDDADDMCDALLHPELRFDLRPLREACAGAYGAGPGALLLVMTDPATVGAPALDLLRYEF